MQLECTPFQPHIDYLMCFIKASHQNLNKHPNKPNKNLFLRETSTRPKQYARMISGVNRHIYFYSRYNQGEINPIPKQELIQVGFTLGSAHPYLCDLSRFCALAHSMRTGLVLIYSCDCLIPNPTHAFMDTAQSWLPAGGSPAPCPGTAGGRFLSPQLQVTPSKMGLKSQECDAGTFPEESISNPCHFAV